jgi:hypothetical protein
MKVSRRVAKFTGILIFIALSLQAAEIACVGEAYSFAVPGAHSNHKMENTAHEGGDKEQSSGHNMDLCQYQCSSSFIQTLPASITFYSTALIYVAASNDLSLTNISRTIFQPPRNIL